MFHSDYIKKIHALHSQAHDLHMAIHALMNELEDDRGTSDEWQMLYAQMNLTSSITTTLYTMLQPRVSHVAPDPAPVDDRPF